MRHEESNRSVRKEALSSAKVVGSAAALVCCRGYRAGSMSAALWATLSSPARRSLT